MDFIDFNEMLKRKGWHSNCCFCFVFFFLFFKGHKQNKLNSFDLDFTHIAVTHRQRAYDTTVQLRSNTYHINMLVCAWACVCILRANTAAYNIFLSTNLWRILWLRLWTTKWIVSLMLVAFCFNDTNLITSPSLHLHYTRPRSSR